MLLLRAVHVSSTFEFRAVFHDCLREDPQGNPPLSSFSGATWMNCVVIHVSSIIKCEASGDWEASYSVVFQIGSFAKYVYMCIYVLYSFVLVVVCILFCAEEKKEEVETRVVIMERQGGRNQCPIFAFLLSPMRGK